MKKLFLVSLICLFVISMTLTAFGASFSDWTALDYADNKVEVSGEAIKVSGTGYYSAAAIGATYNKSVDLKNFSFEVSFDKLGGFGDTGGDHWFGINLLNNKVFFDLANPGKGEGLVVLFRPLSDGKLQAQVFELSQAFGFALVSDGAYEVPKFGEKTKVEFKKNAETGYDFIVNGNKIAGDLTFLTELLKDDAAYFSFSGSDRDKANIQFTLYTVNGEPAAKAADAAPTEKASTEKASTEKAATANPKTADASAVTFVLLAAASAVAMGKIKSRK